MVFLRPAKFLYLHAFKSLCILFLCICPLIAFAQITGIVISVIDGDTVDILVNQTPVRVRLSQIDAPEKGQAFAAQSRKALALAIQKKKVFVQVTGQDRYGRILDGTNINHLQVAGGWAWAFNKYVLDRSLFDLQAQAKASRLGLWADLNPIPPWEWRQAK